MTTDAKRAPAAKSGAVHETVEIVKTIVYALLIALVLRVVLFQPYTIPSASEEPNLYEGDYIIVSKWSYGWSKHSIPLSPPIFSGRILFHQPERGDIVVFKLPHDAESKGTDYIKRLVGLPGDRIQVKAGQLYINDKALSETKLAPGMGDIDEAGAQPVDRFEETNPSGRKYIIQRAPDDAGRNANNTGLYVVPPHCYFMMGDNRDNSLDSRFDPFMPMSMTGSQTCGWDESVDQNAQTDPDHPGVGFVPEEDLVGKAQFVLASWKPGASLLKPWTWIAVRPDRFFHALK
jgi:signal peptidase I